MSTSCIMGSVCSAAPPQSQLWMSGDRGSCQPCSPGSGPLQRGVQCLAGAKGSQHTAVPAISPGDSAGAAELWEAAVGHQNRRVWTKGQLQRDAFGIAAPTASSSLAWLIPALLSLNQSGLELQRPVWHEKAPAAAPSLRHIPAAGRAWHPLPACGTATAQLS